MTANEIKKELSDIKKWEEKIKRKDLTYETKNYVYHFQQYDTKRSFIYSGKINMTEY